MLRILSFASASVCARLETRSSSNVTGCLSGSAIVLPHLITLSALTSTFGGIVRPICLAAFRLMISSNFFGCSNRDISRLCAFENLVYVSGGATVQIGNARAVGHKPPIFHKFWPGVYRREPALYREI